MRSLDRGKLLQLGLLNFFLRFLVVSPTELERLNLSTRLNVSDALVSRPLGYFKLGIFPFQKKNETSYYLTIRYAVPSDPAVDVWVPNRNNGLTSSKSYLQLSQDGNLELIDQDTTNPWSSNTPNLGIQNAQLLDSGNLVLEDNNGRYIWESLKNRSSLTDTLLPGQFFNRSFNQNLTSWLTKDDPASGKYTFGWGTRDSSVSIANASIKSTVSILQLACKMCEPTPRGAYIPAPDVYNPHIVSNAEYVYFHPTLGGLYFPSPVADTITFSPLPNASTVILSDFQQPSNKTLKRLTLDRDGGLRIWQWIMGTSSKWEPVANWVVSERGSQCFAQNTCGPFGLCEMTPAGSLDRVQCTCPEGFEPIDKSDASSGCVFIVTLTVADLCAPPNTSTASDTIMKEHDGVDMPWGGDYKYLNGSASENCSGQCLTNCTCYGAVYSKDEKRCWLKSGPRLYNLGYPTVALHGTDRTAYIKISTKQPKSSRAHRKANLGVILGAVLGGAVCVCIGMFCIYKLRNSLRRICGGVCTKRISHSDGTLHYPGPDDEPRQPETLGVPH